MFLSCLVCGYKYNVHMVIEFVYTVKGGKMPGKYLSGKERGRVEIEQKG